MDTVELHSAFHWNCDACGRTNFLPAVVADLEDDAARRAHEGLQLVQFEATDEDPIGCDGVEQMVSRLVIGPAAVECEHCGARYLTELPHRGS